LLYHISHSSPTLDKLQELIQKLHQDNYIKIMCMSGFAVYFTFFSKVLASCFSHLSGEVQKSSSFKFNLIIFTFGKNETYWCIHVTCLWLLLPLFSRLPLFPPFSPSCWNSRTIPSSTRQRFMNLCGGGKRSELPQCRQCVTHFQHNGFEGKRLEKEREKK
jgi:hypothetical protein